MKIKSIGLLATITALSAAPKFGKSDHLIQDSDGIWDYPPITANDRRRMNKGSKPTLHRMKVKLARKANLKRIQRHKKHRFTL